MIGETVSHYRVLNKLGGGGMIDGKRQRTFKRPMSRWGEYFGTFSRIYQRNPEREAPMLYVDPEPVKGNHSGRCPTQPLTARV